MTEPVAPVAVERCHEALKWFLPIIERWPRSRRHGLGSRLEAELLEVLGALVMASYARQKSEDLRQANRHLAVARHLWRLAMELGIVGAARHSHGAGLLVELGRQVGGWQRHANSST